MVTKHRVRQPSDQVVDIASWDVDPDFPTYPEGKQPKKLLVSPEGELPPFLLPGHRYLFKTPRGWQERQVWSELIAYELSRCADLDVPPCFLAIDGNTGQTGVLVEFFYGYRGEQALRFVPGADFMHAWRAGNYDRKRGRPHDVRSNLTIVRSLGIPAYKEWWGRTFLFDALIGNGDRHPDNWGLLLPSAMPSPDYRMAPLFDHGSSLSYGDPDERLHQIGRDLDSYIKRGRHHCWWKNEQEGSTHIELCGLFIETFKPAGMLDDFVIRFSDEAISDVLGWCRNFNCAIEFSQVRAEFLRSLLIRRRELLTALCRENE